MQTPCESFNCSCCSLFFFSLSLFLFRPWWSRSLFFLFPFLKSLTLRFRSSFLPLSDEYSESTLSSELKTGLGWPFSSKNLRSGLPPLTWIISLSSISGFGESKRRSLSCTKAWNERSSYWKSLINQFGKLYSLYGLSHVFSFFFHAYLHLFLFLFLFLRHHWQQLPLFLSCSKLWQEFFRYFWQSHLL